jgi:hypothetical protein
MTRRSSRVRARLRAYCTVHSPVRLAVMPPRYTRRVPCLMNTRTYSLLSSTVSPFHPGRWRSCAARPALYAGTAERIRCRVALQAATGSIEGAAGQQSLHRYSHRGDSGDAHCRRGRDMPPGPGRQAGAARPDMVNAATLPYARPLKHLRSRWSRSRPRARHLEGCRPAWGEVTLFSPSTVTPARYRWRPSLPSFTRWSLRHAPIGQLAHRPWGDPGAPRILLARRVR